MKKFNIFYTLDSFPNKKYDRERLRNQIKSFYKDLDISPYSGGIMVYSETDFTDTQKTKLDEVISAHDGLPLNFLNKETSDRRRKRLQGLLAMAYDRVDLKPVFPLFQKYFNYRNKELDGYIYYGAFQELIDMVNADKEAGQPFHQILNGVVTDGLDGEPDILAYQFLINAVETDI